MRKRLSDARDLDGEFSPKDAGEASSPWKGPGSANVEAVVEMMEERLNGMESAIRKLQTEALEVRNLIRLLKKG